MMITESLKLGLLFETDETAWLEIMSALAAEGRPEEMDLPNLSAYLADMAKRDRREVFSRLVVLLTHLLMSAHQPDRSGNSWRATIRAQRRELRQLIESGTLRNHAAAVLADAYVEARGRRPTRRGSFVKCSRSATPGTLIQSWGDPDA